MFGVCEGQKADYVALCQCKVVSIETGMVSRDLDYVLTVHSTYKYTALVEVAS